MSAMREAISEQKLLFASIVVGIVCIALAMLFGWAEPLFFVAILICGTPIIIGALRGVIEDHDITADVLVSIAIVAANLIGEYEAAAGSRSSCRSGRSSRRRPSAGPTHSS